MGCVGGGCPQPGTCMFTMPTLALGQLSPNFDLHLAKYMLV